MGPSSYIINVADFIITLVRALLAVMRFNERISACYLAAMKGGEPLVPCALC